MMADADGYYFLLLRMRQEDAVSSEGLEKWKEEPICWRKVGGKPLTEWRRCYVSRAWKRIGRTNVLAESGRRTTAQNGEDVMCQGPGKMEGGTNVLAESGRITFDGMAYRCYVPRAWTNGRKNQCAGGKREENHCMGQGRCNMQGTGKIEGRI
jgi:hypothetical protein